MYYSNLLLIKIEAPNIQNIPNLLDGSKTDLDAVGLFLAVAAFSVVALGGGMLG